MVEHLELYDVYLRERRKKPLKRRICILQALLSEEPCNASRRQISIPRMNLTSAPFDLQPVLEMAQRQPVGTSLSALVKRERSNHSALEAPTGKCGATIVHLPEHHVPPSSDPLEGGEAEQHQREPGDQTDASPFAA
jgi:hypothetical protein